MKVTKTLTVVVFGILGLFLIAGVRNCVKCYSPETTCGSGKESALVHGVCMCVERPKGYEP